MKSIRSYAFFYPRYAFSSFNIEWIFKNFKQYLLKDVATDSKVLLWAEQFNAMLDDILYSPNELIW